MSAGGPAGPDALFPLLEAACAVEGAGQVEAAVTRSWGGLTRFAANTVHQHVATADAVVRVRVVVGERVGVATSNRATPEGAVEAARRAVAAARVTPPDPELPGVAGPAPVPPARERFHDATAAASPARRTAAVAALIGGLRRGQEAAGAVSTGAEERALLTTAGARMYGAATRAAASTVVAGGGATGHAEDAGRALDALDTADVGERAAETCAADPVRAPPGAYEVVLLPSAVTTLLEYLAFTAFSAKAYDEGRSAFNGRLGTAVASPLVTVADDALAPGALGLRWDEEGTPKQRVELIARGVAAAVVHDRRSAGKAGTSSTGHGLAPPNPWGPLPTNLVLEPGDASVEELVAGVDRGLLVTRFWYTRAVNPRRALVTGMTRDGTFFVEGGERARPVRNLRYNQGILDALATCDGVGVALRTCSDELADTRAPAVRLRAFTFTSSSDH